MTIDPHSYPIRVFYEDTDIGGLVYHANYLKFFERARTEWLRDLGIKQSVFLEQNMAFVIRHIDINYLGGASLDDLLDIRTAIIKRKRASLIFSQEIVNQHGVTISNATITVASVNLENAKPMAIPTSIVGALERVC